MKFQAIAAQLEFLEWRDAQMAAISMQLETAYPALIDELRNWANLVGNVDLVRSTITLKSTAEDLMRRWSATQLSEALARAEADLDQTLLQLPDRLSIDRDTWEQVSTAIPAIAGVGLIGASVAAIPTVISFATVSTSVLAFWGTATISWPIFALGAAGIGLAALTGSRSLKFAHDRARAKLRERLEREAGRQIFGIGENPGARCVLSDIQAAVLQAGQRRIQGDDQ